MRVILPILLILTLAGAYALGRSQFDGVTPALDPKLSSVASFGSAFEQGKSLERSYRFHGFLQTMGPDPVAEAAEIIAAGSPWLVEDELRNFMIAWTSFDPSAALEWGLSRSGQFRSQAAVAALDGWAFNDPVAAQSAFQSMDIETAPSGMEEGLIAGWLQSGRREGIIEYIASRPRGMERQRYTNLLTIELMRESPDAVIRWAEAVPNTEGVYKRVAFQKAANILATVDPVRASTWIEPYLQYDYAKRGPGVIGQRWLELDPEAALNWLASLPRSESNDKALRAALRVWLNGERTGAEAWVRSAEPGEGVDLAVEEMISRSSEDPKIALAWAKQIADRPERMRTIMRLARTWMRSDPEAAKRWLEQSDMTPKMKRAVSAPTRRGEDDKQRPARTRRKRPGGAKGKTNG